MSEATIIKIAVDDLTKSLNFTAAEIATFKQALCDNIKKANDSSNKMFWASVIYFVTSLILSATIAFSALVQAGIIKKS